MKRYRIEWSGERYLVWLVGDGVDTLMVTTPSLLDAEMWVTREAD